MDETTASLGLYFKAIHLICAYNYACSALVTSYYPLQNEETELRHMCVGYLQA
jgi:hypothetical protein